MGTLMRQRQLEQMRPLRCGTELPNHRPRLKQLHIMSRTLTTDTILLYW